MFFFTWSSVPRSKTVVIVQTFFNLWCTKQTLHLVGVSTRTTQGVHKNLEEFQTILNSHLVKSEMEFTMFLTCEIRCKIFINLMVENQLIHRDRLQMYYERPQVMEQVCSSSFNFLYIWSCFIWRNSRRRYLGIDSVLAYLLQWGI